MRLVVESFLMVLVIIAKLCLKKYLNNINSGYNHTNMTALLPPDPAKKDPACWIGPAKSLSSLPTYQFGFPKILGTVRPGWSAATKVGCL
jgi:hypothetical protein